MSTDQPTNQPAYQPFRQPPWPPKRSFWHTTRGTWTILGIVAGSLALIGGAIIGLSALGSAGADEMEVKLVSCQFESDFMPTATVEYTITNTGSSARGARIHFEYRDSAGNRVDTDTARVRSIQPGDTVRAEEVTFLDATVSSGTCRIVGIE